MTKVIVANDLVGLGKVALTSSLPTHVSLSN